VHDRYSHSQTDRHDCHVNTALCTVVHRAVKNGPSSIFWNVDCDRPATFWYVTSPTRLSLWRKLKGADGHDGIISTRLKQIHQRLAGLVRDTSTFKSPFSRRHYARSYWHRRCVKRSTIHNISEKHDTSMYTCSNILASCATPQVSGGNVLARVFCLLVKPWLQCVQFIACNKLHM